MRKTTKILAEWLINDCDIKKTMRGIKVSKEDIRKAIKKELQIDKLKLNFKNSSDFIDELSKVSLERLKVLIILLKLYEKYLDNLNKNDIINIITNNFKGGNKNAKTKKTSRTSKK